jgi:hypothetical protein
MNLPFADISFNDAGLYKLRVTYRDCQGVIRQVFTQEIMLNVFDEATIVHQTNTLHAILSGFTTLSVDVVTSGSTDNPGIIPVNYQ